MKRALSVFCIVVACAGMLAAAPLVGISVEASPQAGLMFDDAWDPGYSGTALGVNAYGSDAALRWEAGVEAGSSPIGWQVLAPLRVGVGMDAGPVSLDALMELDPGASLTRPSLAILGIGALGRATWRIWPAFGLTASVGVRCTVCSAYKEYTGLTYESLDLPFTIGARWVLGNGSR
jgi:hypothetical protein